MSETRVVRRQGRFIKVEGYTCTDCGVWGPNGEFHPWLFCLLHKQGWTREQIIKEIRRCSEELAEEER